VRAWFLSASLLVPLLGCGDGIGHPIVQGEAALGGTAGLAGGAGPTMAAGGSGIAGASGSLETAGSAGALAGMGGNGGSFAGGAGQAWSGAGGPANPQGGTAGSDEMDFGEPWDPDFGGPGGPERGEDPGFAVPAGEHCASVVEWDREAAELEHELYTFLNFARQSGFACAEESSEPLPPLQMRPELRCAARLHSRNMREDDFFDHIDRQDRGPEERMRDAGAMFAIAAESIARDLEMPDFADPYRALSELFAEDGSDCRNVMDDRFDAVGIGLFQGLWTLDFTGR
jgi:uncharacterized protein YkwD